MKKYILFSTILITVLLLSQSSVFAVRTGGSYEIISDCIGFGGGSSAGGDYVNDCTYTAFVSTLSESASEITGGQQCNINNLPWTVITDPLHNMVTDYITPAFIWNYNDYDLNPQGGFEVQLSTDTNFGIINYTSNQTDSSSSNWTPGENISEGIYYWRAKVKDSPWHEWSLNYSTDTFKITIDTTVPVNITQSLTAHVSSITMNVSALDTTELDFQVKYSTSAGFAASVSTTTAWFYGPVTASTQTLTLISNTTYYFQTQAKDYLEKLSGWSSTSSRVSLARPVTSYFTFPFVSSGSINVSWSLDNNPADTTFVARASTTNFSGGEILHSTVTAVTNATFDGLSTNTTYYFQVQVLNHEGAPASSATLGSVSTLVSQPENVSWGIVTNSSMQINWAGYTPDNPGSTIYTIEVSTHNDFSSSVHSSQTVRSAGQAVISPLQTNTTYYGRIIATNWANLSSTTTLTPSWRSTLPTAPDNLLWVSITTTTMSVSFGASDPVNPADTIYELQLSPSASFSSISSSRTVRGTGISTVTISGLTPNATYFARVLGIAWDTAVSTGTLIPAWHSTLPSQPAGIEFVTADTTNSLIKIKWSASSPENPANTIYTVQTSSSPDFYPVKDSSTTVRGTGEYYATLSTNITPNTTYYARVIAQNWESVCSTANVSGVEVTLPSQPVAEWCAPGTIGTTTMTINWSASSPDNPADTIYIVEISTVSSDFTSTLYSAQAVRSADSATVTGLPVNTTCYARVMAQNWSLERATYTVTGSSATKSNTPAVIAGIVNWNSTDGYSLKLTIDTNGNPAGTEYLIKRDSTEFSWTEYTNGQILTRTGLNANTTYTYQIKSRNRNLIESSYSTGISSVTSPSQVLSPGLSSNAYNQIQWAWTKVDEAAQYNVYTGTGAVFTVLGADTTGCTVPNLIPNTSYSINIESENQYGKGQPSVTVSTYTYSQIPGAPYVTSVTSGSFNITFSSQSNPASTGYLIRCLVETTTKYVQANGLLDTSQVWQTFAQWDPENLIHASGLEPSSSHSVSVKTRNYYNIESDYSVSDSTVTISQMPGPEIVSVTTGTIKVILNLYDNPINQTYAIRVLEQGSSWKYVQTNGDLHSTNEVWAGTSTWGGAVSDSNAPGITINVPNAANTYHTVAVAAKTVAGTQYSDYLMTASTYTLAQVPEIALVSETSESITFSLDSMDNASNTLYAFKAVLADNTTRYLQPNFTEDTFYLLEQPPMWMIKSLWVTDNKITIESLEPNFGYSISAVAMNSSETPIETEYSNIVSTWTSLTMPSAPTLFSSYDAVNDNNILISINSTNSQFTEYALQVQESLNFVYLNGDGQPSYDKVWHTKEYWESYVTTHTLGGLTENTLYKVRINARSTARSEETGLSATSEITTPTEAPVISSVNDGNDTILIQWGGVSNSVYYRIYYSSVDTPSDDSFVSITTMSYTQTSYSHDIDGSSPSIIDTSTLELSTTALTVAWQPENNPAISSSMYYKVSTINSDGAESEKSSFFGPVYVQPIITKYTLYTDTGGFIADIQSPTSSYIYSELTPNTSYGFQITAHSSDELEGTKSVLFSTYTLAALASDAAGTASWDITNKYYNLVTFSSGDNPEHTEYAVSAKETNGTSYSTKWLTSDGSTASSRIWLTSTSWLHNHLDFSTGYTYKIYSRNYYKIESEDYVTVETTSTLMNEIEITNFKCRYSETSSEVLVPKIQADSSDLYYITNSSTPYFTWDVSYTSFPVVGYSMSWSSYSNVIPDSTTDYVYLTDTGAYWKTDITHETGGFATYYFRLKAKDDEGHWSDRVGYEYRFRDDVLQPVLSTGTFAFSGARIYGDGVYYGVPLNAVLEVPFTEEMSSGTFTTDNIYIESVKNSMEEAVTQKINPGLQYVGSTLTVTASLESNWTYELVITTNVRDIVLNPLENEYRMTIRTVISSAAVTDNIVLVKNEFSNLEAKVVIPPGAVTDNSYIVMDNNPIEGVRRSITKTNYDTALSKLDPKNNPLWFVGVNMYSAGTHEKVENTNFDTSVLLSMDYKDESPQDGIVDGTSIRAQSLSIWWFDEDKNVWFRIPSQVNSSDKTVSVYVKHFSVFAIAGSIHLSVDDVIVAPVPWIPKDGDTNTGTLAGGITFANLPQQGEIRIYTITGNLVRSIEFGDYTDYTQGVIWDGRNTTGTYAASGVYLWVVKSPQAAKTGKLIVIR